jgi:hypothetical protein
MKYAEQVITIACDDIRHEVGNKRSLMGIYDDIIIRSVPQLMPKICLAVSFKKVKKAFTTVKSIQTTLKSPTGERIELPEMKPPGNIQIGGNYNMDIFVVPLKIDKVGTFVWELRFDGEEKPVIIHKTIIKTTQETKQ